MITYRNIISAFLEYDEKVLLMKRGLHKKIAPGKWSAIAGHIEAEEIYKDENIKKFAAEASKQEAACYKAVAPGSDINMPTKPKIFENNGLELVSVMCKIGGVEKEFLGLIDKEKINPGKFESMCNPIGQALALNEAKTDFNIAMP